MKTPAPYQDEFVLMQQFALGERAAFNAIYKEYYLHVYHFAQKFVPQAADAEDMTADTFVKLWDKRSDLNNLEHVSAFLHVTVRNSCIDFLRRQQTKSAATSGIIEQLTKTAPRQFELQELRAELMDLVYDEVNKLPAKMKQVFLLYYKEGLKPSGIAEKLQLSVQTVSNQKSNAINLLKAALGNNPLLLALLLCLEFPQGGWA